MSVPLRRKRRCADCGKPLGSTVGRCYECGGEDPSLTREERLQDARTWKILFGIPPQKIAAAHGVEE